MAAKTTHFRVGNGDMTLFEFESGTTLLVDCNIRDAADDPDEETADVGTQIRSRLKRDSVWPAVRRCFPPYASRPGSLPRAPEPLPSGFARRLEQE